MGSSPTGRLWEEGREDAWALQKTDHPYRLADMVIVIHGFALTLTSQPALGISSVLVSGAI